MAITSENAMAFKSEVEQKIEGLLDQFAGGDISREHFDVVYERYSRQLNIAEQAIETGRLEKLNQVMNEIPTMMLHAAVRGMAVGMTVIHHTTMRTIRSFGDFTLNDEQYDALMTNLHDKHEHDILSFSEIHKLFGNTWVIVSSLENTTLLTMFRNEPSAKQVQELERRHRDFESANRNILKQSEPNPDTLVYPVELFVQAS